MTPPQSSRTTRPRRRTRDDPPPGLRHHWGDRADGAALLPARTPRRVLGTAAQRGADPELLRGLYRELVAARRFNEQAAALAKQGRLAIYPASTGQEACQVGAALALRPQDWLFPSYRDTAAVVTRGVDPVEALTLLRGDAHSGYDPRAARTAPLCTPLANQLPHAAGLAHAARLAGDDTCALALIGDGGTSEGDFHEALNFAAVRRSPLVVLVQNNGYAISVPLEKQSAAPALADKAAGYGMPGVLVDGMDAAAVHGAVAEALERARSGGGPTLVEAVTYRFEPHTNTDDETRYRTADEVAAWRARDPLTVAEAALREAGVLDDAVVRAAREAADERAAALRTRLHRDPDPAPEPLALFDHVYAEPTQQLAEQRAQLAAELEAAREESGAERDAGAGDGAARHRQEGGVR